MAGRKQPPRLNPECKECLVALTDDNWTASMQKYRRYVCKVCWTARQIRYAKKDPKYKEKRQAKRLVREATWSAERREADYQRRKCNYLQKTYGITLEDYERMLTGQGGLCKICSTDKPGGKGVFVVDHCHTGGQVRGLLCMSCNIMLGRAYDDTTILQNAINYLEDNK